MEEIALRGTPTSAPPPSSSSPERRSTSSDSSSGYPFTTSTGPEGKCCSSQLDSFLGRYAFHDESHSSPWLPHPRRLEAWLSLLNPSRWLIRTIRLGYAIKLVRRPPRFRGILFTSVRSDTDASVLLAEIAVLLVKDAIEPVPPAEMKTGFYSSYFIGRAYQLKVLPFGLALSPRIFTKLAEGALAPLWEQDIRILNHLDDWLISLTGFVVRAQGPEHLFSRYGAGFGQHDGVPHGGACTVGAQMSESVQTQNSGPFKEFSEAPGAYGLLHMRPLQHWLHGRIPRWVPLGQVSKHVTVNTDASSTGWGAVCNRQAASGSWTGPRLRWHINCLKLLAVFLTLHRFHSTLSGRHVLVHTDNMEMVAYIIHQGGLRSRRMSQLACHLLLWSQKWLRLLHAIHIPGELNRAADALSRQLTLPGERRLHPQSPPISQVRLSPSELLCTDLVQDQGGWGAGSWNSCSSRQDLLSQGKGTIWHPRPDLWNLSDLSGLPQAVIDTITQARAPSTRQAYALRSMWQPSTAYHDAVDGLSLGGHHLIVRFLRGARRLNPPRPHLILSWDLSVVLSGLRRDSFEPLESVEFKYLSLKTTLLIVLTSIKRTPAQVVNLQALPPEEADPALALPCPVCALRIYVDRTRIFRHSEQLFVCFGGQQKGNAVSKQRLAHWVVDAITLAYRCQGEPCPLGVRAHSTRSVASSWALGHAASLADICRAAGWATPNTIVRFYNLGVEPVSSRVLRSEVTGLPREIPQYISIDVTSPFPSSGNEGYSCNRTVPNSAVKTEVRIDPSCSCTVHP
ncbi:ORF V: Enzymatic polyprotein [Labeo rohita]|uniref:ORF V: Enzymatic polyprotein n=1 Tax=Labeo rohita TaxID=84645 RepID=A0ABQ8LCG1_LABRO|nr:ORF V: Enzymatic polyprotein [Labeo rohita]